MDSYGKIHAVVIIFDVWQPPCHTLLEDGKTFFEKSRDCISWVLKRKIMSSSKDLISLLLTGTDEPGDPIDDLDVGMCRNISVKYDFQTPSWKMLNFIDNKVKMSDKTSDWIGALAVAIQKFTLLEQLFGDHTKEHRNFHLTPAILYTVEDKDNIIMDLLNTLNVCFCYRSFNVLSKTVVVFSDLKNSFTDAVNYVLTNIKKLSIEVTVIGPENICRIQENMEDDEPAQKRRRTENEITDMLDEERIDGEKFLNIMWNTLGDLVRITNFDSALRQLSSYTKKTVRATPWNCIMDIADLKINIQMFKKVDSKSHFRASFKTRKPGESGRNSLDEDSSQSLTDTIRDKIMYYKHLEPSTFETKKISVGPEDIISGYRYGSSVIPFSDEDKSILGYKPGKKCLSVLGFADIDKVPYYILTGEGSYIVVPRQKDEKAEVALSAIIQAMSETGKVAIVRRVYSDDRGLSLGVLYPVFEDTGSEELGYKACLVFIELGFGEDIRTVRLPRLRRVKKKLTPEQYKAVDSIIDEMDLMKVKSETGDEYEALDLYSRHEMKSQFFQHCLVHKALYPEKPLPEKLPEHSQDYNTYVNLLASKSKIFSENLGKLFPMRTKSKSEGSNAEEEDCGPRSENFYKFSNAEEKTAESCFKRLFGLYNYPPVADIQNLLDLSVREFKFEVKDVAKAFLHFTKVAREKTMENFTDDFNYWMRRLRINIGIEGELEKDYWKGVLEDNLGLITMEEHADSNSSKENAECFFDSLKPKSELTEEEKRREAEEIEEAVNLLF